MKQLRSMLYVQRAARLAGVMFCVLMLCQAGSARAALNKIFWEESASPDGEWSEPGNWDPRNEPYPPIPTDMFQARISGGWTANLDSAGAIAASLLVGKNQGEWVDDSGTLNIYGGDLTVKANALYPYIWPSQFHVGHLAPGWVYQYGGDVYVDGDPVNHWGLVIGGTDSLLAGRGNGTYDLRGGSLVVAGRIMIGRDNSPGRLIVGGDATAITALSGEELNLYSASTLEFVIGPGGVKTLDVSGSAILDGALEVRLVDGFTPTVGQTFTLIDSANLSNIFVNVTGLEIATGLAFDLVYDLDMDDVRLEVIATALPALAGDFDGSGVVDTQDINPFVLALTDPSGYEAAYGVPASTYDLTHDGLVNTEDINPFVAVLTGGGAEAMGAIIPEPASAYLLALGLLALGRRR